MSEARVEKRAGPRLGVAVLVTDAMGRLLLGRRGKTPNYGKWVIPGGGIEHGESWVVAAERELREETGLNVRVSSKQQPHVVEVLGTDDHRLILYVRGEVAGGELKPSSDLLEAQFFSRDGIPVADLSAVVAPVLDDFGWGPRGSIAV